MTEARRHHFLPQAYLAGFTDTGTKEGAFHVLDVESARGFTTSPLNVGVERDFNAIDSDHQPLDALEHALSKFEGELAEALRRIRAGTEFPNPEDLNCALNLISLLAARNPRVRAMAEKAKKQTARIAADLVTSDPSFFEAAMRAARADGYVNGPEVSFEEVREHVRGLGSIEWVVPPSDHHHREFRRQGKLLEGFGKRVWSLLLAAPGSAFISGDHPVCLLPGTAKDTDELGFFTPGTVLYFPLSSRLALHGVLAGKPWPEVVTLTADNVARANTQVLRGSLRHVYSLDRLFRAMHRGREQTVDVITSGTTKQRKSGPQTPDSPVNNQDAAEFCAWPPRHPEGPTGV